MAYERYRRQIDDRQTDRQQTNGQRKWKKERKTTKINKKHHLDWKYRKSDKSDLFANRLKATTERTSSLVMSKLFQGAMIRSQKKFLRKFMRWKLGYNFHWWPLVMDCNLTHNVQLCDVLETVSSKRSHWTRLCGACTMLVLLGVPWIFSAFAVIDAEGSKDLEMLQGIFNVSDLLALWY